MDAAVEDQLPTAEDVKSAVQQLIAAKGVIPAQKLFKALGIARPGDTPADKVERVLGYVQRMTKATAAEETAIFSELGAK